MIIEAFAESHLTHNLSPQQIESLFSAGVIQRYEADTLVINEGEVLRNLYVILAGEVSVFLPAGDERLADVQLSVLQKNNCLGEYSFIDHQPASASVRCKTDCVLYQIDDQTLEAYLSEHQAAGSIIYRNLLVMLVARLRLNNKDLDLFRVSDTPSSVFDRVV